MTLPERAGGVRAEVELKQTGGGMQIFLLWFLLRISSFLVAANASSVQAFTNLERRLPV